MQKKDKEGKTVECKAPNALEIQQFIEETHNKLEAMTRVPGAADTSSRPIPPSWQAEWSLDNANVHKAAYTDPAWLKKPLNARFGEVQPPPYSPDFHKVIEHVHGTLCSAFKKWLREHAEEAALMDLPTLFKQLEQLFYKCITKESVQKDVMSLSETIIQVRALKGAYPAARYR